MNTQSDATELQQVGTISLDFTWSGTLPMLLAGLVDGTSAGKAIAKEHLTRMAAVADLAVHAAAALQQVADSGIQLPPGALDAVRDWHRVARLSRAGTASGARPDDHSAQISIGYCVNGFYLGICDDNGECQRESVETWPTRDTARRALDSGDWTRRTR